MSDEQDDRETFWDKVGDGLRMLLVFIGISIAMGGCRMQAAELTGQKPTTSPVVVADKPVDPVSGREVMCDLPGEQHLRNIRGKNGSGCCVWASGEMMSRWFNFAQLKGLLAEGLGGATDSDVERMFARKTPGFKGYVQATGRPSVSLCDWAMRTGRLPCVTYGQAHMVILVHLDPADTPNPRGCIIDNNQPSRWIWMSRDEFIKRHGQGGAWSYCLTIAPPPPIPVLREGVQ